MIYDCTPPPEKPVPAIIRHLHNVLHPHHRKLYVPVKPLMCGDPDMVEIVVTAPPYPPDPPLVGYVFDPCCVIWPANRLETPDDPRDSPRDPERGPVLRPVSVPEPGPLLLMLTAALGLWIVRRRR